jgi:hypothetical protein
VIVNIAPPERREKMASEAPIAAAGRDIYVSVVITRLRDGFARMTTHSDRGIVDGRLM